MQGYFLRIRSSLAEGAGPYRARECSGMAPSVIKDAKIQLKGHSNWCRDAVWSPDGDMIGTACADNFLRVFPATRQRDCVQPRVPRTRHVAVSGANHNEEAATSAASCWDAAEKAAGPSPWRNHRSL